MAAGRGWRDPSDGQARSGRRGSAMTAAAPLGEHTGALLERAIAYAVGVLPAVTDARLASPTPCADWDVRRLMLHAIESVTTIGDGMRDRNIAIGDHSLETPEVSLVDCYSADVLTGLFRGAAGDVLAAWVSYEMDESPGSGSSVSIADRELSTELLAGIGALEIATHGWDVAVGCGERGQVPSALALELLPLARELVVDRCGLFGAPVPVSPLAHPGDQLVAFLGRVPDHRP